MSESNCQEFSRAANELARNVIIKNVETILSVLHVDAANVTQTDLNRARANLMQIADGDEHADDMSLQARELARWLARGLPNSPAEIV